jgi:putative FmdB family regulatory protein
VPRYDFLCACGNRFEEVATMGTEIVPCPECHRGAKRQFTVAKPDQVRLWPERWAVTRSQVCAPVKRTLWKGVEGLK